MKLNPNIKLNLKKKTNEARESVKTGGKGKTCMAYS